jgi:hypothetical protein
MALPVVSVLNLCNQFYDEPMVHRSVSLWFDLGVYTERGAQVIGSTIKPGQIAHPGNGEAIRVSSLIIDESCHHLLCSLSWRFLASSRANAFLRSHSP